MIQILVQYLLKNGQLSLPNIGTLKWSKQESFWENNKFVAPKENISFELNAVYPGKHFFIYLAEELSVSIDQANLQFEAFINEFNNKKQATLQFGNLGILQKNDDVISWDSTYHANLYYKDLVIQATSRNNEFVNNVVQKDKWWIWAIVFFLISIGLIAYKYYCC